MPPGVDRCHQLIGTARPEAGPPPSTSDRFAQGERRPLRVPVDDEHPTVPEDSYATPKVANAVRVAVNTATGRPKSVPVNSPQRVRPNTMERKRTKRRIHRLVARPVVARRDTGSREEKRNTLKNDIRERILCA